MIETPSVVPVVNSDSNKTPADVIGNKNDDHTGDSIKADTYTIEEHIHSKSKVYPTLTDGVTLTAGAAWVLGVFAEIVPLNTITLDFDIHYVSIEDISANGVYELVLYSDADGIGGDEVEIGRVRFTRNAIQSATLNVPMTTPIVSANSQIKAKLAGSNAGQTAVISIFYHTY